MRKSLLPCLAILMLALSGCQYKDLCYDHHHWVDVNVVYHWDLAPDAEVEGMVVQFYDPVKETVEPMRYELPGMAGGRTRLLPGDWQPISYNNDTESILFRGMASLGTFEAYTRSSSVEEGTRLMTRSGMPRAAGTEGQPVILDPDPLWGVVGDPFTLHIGDPAKTVDLYPVPLFKHVYITIRDVPNIQYTNGFGGALSGLAPSIRIADQKLGEELVTQAFDGHVPDPTTVTMHTLIFGHCPHLSEGVENEHILTIYAILADGSKWYYTVDVTDQMHDKVKNPPESQNIYIDLEGLDVPKPIVNGSGFHPTVDDWASEEIDLRMSLK